MNRYRRRTGEDWGYIKFPSESNGYHNTGEGGMYVVLVASPSKALSRISLYGPILPMVEGYIGEDQKAPPVLPSAKLTISRIGKYFEKERGYVNRHFPNYDKHSGSECSVCENFSKQYMVCALLGWSAKSWADKDRNYWRCTKNDLTQKGLSFYNMVGSLYPKCELALLTFLDT